MIELEGVSSSTTCNICGVKYPQRKGNFMATTAQLYKFNGYLPICNKCLDLIYQSYFAQCKNEEKSVHAVCRKLDIYWSKKAFSLAHKSTAGKSIMFGYLSKVNNLSEGKGKSYEDYLLEEGKFWAIGDDKKSAKKGKASSLGENDEYKVARPIIEFWGKGLPDSMYVELEDRLTYWKSQLRRMGIDFNDLGLQALLRQIIPLEIETNRLRAVGQPTEKNVSLLNTLLGSAMLKPAQKKPDETERSLVGVPLGVLTRIAEGKKPMPEVDKSLKDIDNISGIVSLISGHLAKMSNLKNDDSVAYERFMEKYSVSPPVIEDEDGDG